MAVFPLVLVLIGSVLHLAWNVLLKRAKDRVAFLWLAMLPGALLTFPYWFWSHTPAPSSDAWIWITLTVIVHSGYFWTLGRAYGHSELSLVYPYSRGIGAIVSTVGGILLLGDHPSRLGSVGVGLTLLGTVVEPLSSIRHAGKRLRHKAWNGLQFTIATGIAIGLYLIIDSRALRSIAAIPYLGCMFVGCSVTLAGPLLGSGRAQAEFKRSPTGAFGAGILMGISYGVILYAMGEAPVTYVVAVRSSGMVMAGVAGFWFFRENLTLSRIAAIGLIILGVVLISAG
jgi:drug/metabolite transporter (DMT)-like permease